MTSARRVALENRFPQPRLHVEVRLLLHRDPAAWPDAAPVLLALDAALGDRGQVEQPAVESPAVVGRLADLGRRLRQAAVDQLGPGPPPQRDHLLVGAGPRQRQEDPERGVAVAARPGGPGHGPDGEGRPGDVQGLVHGQRHGVEVQGQPVPLRHLRLPAAAATTSVVAGDARCAALGRETATVGALAHDAVSSHRVILGRDDRDLQDPVHRLRPPFTPWDGSMGCRLRPLHPRQDGEHHLVVEAVVGGDSDPRTHLLVGVGVHGVHLVSVAVTASGWWGATARRTSRGQEPPTAGNGHLTLPTPSAE